MSDPFTAGRLPWRIHVAYAAGAIGTAVFGTVPGLLLLYFLTDTLGVPAGLAGLTLATGKLWDVVLDPAVGALSDRTQSRLGRRRPWMLTGGLLMPVAFALVFAVPDLPSPTARWLWVLGAFVLASTAFAVFQVPFVAMPAEMTRDGREQTVLMAWRMSFMIVGILLSGALAPQLVASGGGGRAGYALMGNVLALVCLAAMLAAAMGTAGAPALPGGTPGTVAGQLRAVVGNLAFRWLLAAIVLQLVAMSTLLAVVPYVATYLLAGGQDLVTLLFLCLVGPALAAMPAWVTISRRLGRVRSWAVATIVFAVLNVGLLLATPERLPLTAAVVVAMGLAYGGTQVFPYALLPDAIAAGRSQSGIEQGGVLAGLLTASEKCGNALGALVTGLVLQASGFVETQTGETVVQPATALAGIRLCVSLLPAALLAASVPLVLGWPRRARAGDWPEPNGSPPD